MSSFHNLDRRHPRLAEAEAQVLLEQENTCWIWQIATGVLLDQEVPTEGKNMQRPFNATSVRRNLHEPIIFVRICARTRMSDPLSVPSVARLLHVNTTGRDMKGCTPERRNLYAKALSRITSLGDVEESLPEQMH